MELGFKSNTGVIYGNGRYWEDDEYSWWNDLIHQRQRVVWSDTPACQGMGPEIFYPDGGMLFTKAVKICRTCPVRLECLEYAIENDEEYGVRGGVNESNRAKYTTAGLTAQEMIDKADTPKPTKSPTPKKTKAPTAKNPHVGVTWNTRRGKWLVQRQKHGKRAHIGYFTDVNEAIAAYENAA